MRKIKNCVIVGVDDSPASRAAGRWAVTYAHAAGVELRAVHVLDWPVGLTVSAVKSGTRLYVPEKDVVEPYRRAIHLMFGDLNSSSDSTIQFAQGDVADVLVRLSAQAKLLVVGIRKPLRGHPFPAGTTGRYYISHASCPVVMVPEFFTSTLSELSRPGADQQRSHRPDGAAAVCSWPVQHAAEVPAPEAVRGMDVDLV